MAAQIVVTTHEDTVGDGDVWVSCSWTFLACCLVALVIIRKSVVAKIVESIGKCNPYRFIQFEPNLNWECRVIKVFPMYHEKRMGMQNIAFSNSFLCKISHFTNCFCIFAPKNRPSPISFPMFMRWGSSSYIAWMVVPFITLMVQSTSSSWAFASSQSLLACMYSHFAIICLFGKLEFTVLRVLLQSANNLYQSL